MKKIEAIIKRSKYTIIVGELNNIGYSIIER
jgi:nitrogen regulatory protein PII